MKLSLYRMATTLGGPLIRLYLNKRLKRGKEDPNRFQERLGHASVARPDGPLLWLHAASVGESLSVLPLIERLHQDHPAWTVLVTTGTVTSARLMEERLPDGAIHQYVPVDRVGYVRRFLDHWQPNLALWVESEFWPNLVIETRARAVPMAVLNGRMSDASLQSWRKSRAMIGRLLAAFQVVMAQSERDGERFAELGAKQVQSPGNLKFASPPLPVNDRALETVLNHVGERPRWLAASTHAGEEAIAGAVHKNLKVTHPDLLTIIVPRHPERGTAVAAELATQGLSVALRSAKQDISVNTDIYVADTMGELGLFYRLCDVVFIGKTLCGVGGQNPIEPAQLSCALLFGPEMSNFHDSSSKLVACEGARWVQDQETLQAAVKDLLDDDKTRIHAANAALNMAAEEADVLDRVMQHLALLIKDAENGKSHAGA